MDSSALVALMSRVSDARPKTFSVVFDERKFSESAYSSLVAKRFETDHREIPLSENRLLQMLPRAIASFDQPSMDGINTYVISEAVKDAGVTVALSGLGGDELFAGYPSFRRAVKMEALRRSELALLRGASAVGKRLLNGSIKRRKFWELVSSDGRPETVYRVSELFPQRSNCLLAN